MNKLLDTLSLMEFVAVMVEVLSMMNCVGSDSTITRSTLASYWLNGSPLRSCLGLLNLCSRPRLDCDWFFCFSFAQIFLNFKIATACDIDCRLLRWYPKLELGFRYYPSKTHTLITTNTIFFSFLSTSRYTWFLTIVQ